MRDRLILLAGAVLSLAYTTAQAGRPVYHDLSLAQLTQDSHLIAEVSKVEESTVDVHYGCKSQRWRLSVVEVLKPDPMTGAASRSTLEVHSSPTSIADCLLRSTVSSSGASFSANRYAPSDKAAFKQERFIVFLRRGHHGLELTSDSAFESLKKKPEIQRLIGSR